MPHLKTIEKPRLPKDSGGLASRSTMNRTEQTQARHPRPTEAAIKPIEESVEALGIRSALTHGASAGPIERETHVCALFAGEQITTNSVRPEKFERHRELSVR